MPKKSEISEKHKAFCRALIKHKFNQTKAYQEAYPGTKPNVAKVNAVRLLTNANLQEYLAELTKANEKEELITVEYVINGIKEDIQLARKHKQTSASMKGWELLGKTKAMYTDKVEQDTTLTTNQPIKIVFDD